MQRIQTSVIKASIAITECLNLIMKNRSEMPKKTTSALVGKLGDAIALNSNAVIEIILRRKHLTKPHLKEEYKPLCAPGAPVSFDELMGDDLARSMRRYYRHKPPEKKGGGKTQYTN
ncbi:hypothetical protein SNE40_020039 [Patella caerulea]|uniref:Uncharacterized protein n=1 Tax=Patella caerulea TaxID=87958 RepID=A0AAN8GJS7_PATCE